MTSAHVEPDDSPPLSVELTRVSVPLLVPHRSAAGSELNRESILVRVVGPDGGVGHSECPTLGGGGYVTETTDAGMDGAEP